MAPSGGRDRPCQEGKINPSPFDPASIEIFHLLARQAKTATHFHTLAMATYPILPPPNTVENSIGEKRRAASSPAFLYFGEEIDLEPENFSSLSKDERASRRTTQVWSQMNHHYQFITGKNS